MNAITASSRFVHNREIAPPPTWGKQVPFVPSGRPSVMMSDASRVIARQERRIFNSYQVVTSFRLPLECEFLQRALRWKAETFFHSSISKKTQHPDYQRIIGMGPAVVPLIFHWLKLEPDFWFDALVAITGEQPVPVQHAGDIEAMAHDWLEWGRAHGYDC